MGAFFGTAWEYCLLLRVQAKRRPIARVLSTSAMQSRSIILSLVFSLLCLVGYPPCLHPPSERRQRRFATSSLCRFTTSSRCWCTTPSRCRFATSSVSVPQRPPGVGSPRLPVSVDNLQSTQWLSTRLRARNAHCCHHPSPTLNGLTTKA